MASGADAVVAMGLFGQGMPLSKAIRERRWDVARYGNCGFALYGTTSDNAAELLEGWIAVDLFDLRNPVTADLLDRYAQAHGVRPRSATVCFARDLAKLMLEGIRLAPALTRAGLRRGLEAIRDVPAAAGGAGTRMSFGPADRMALKGPRIFLFNEITPSGLRPLPG
jgi:hypothetical protein